MENTKSGNVEFWGITDILEYAKEMYWQGSNEQDWEENFKSPWDKAIRRELQKYGLTNYDKNDKATQKDRSKPILVAREIAQFIINDVMSEYFLGKGKSNFKKQEKYERRKEIKRKKLLEKIEQESEAYDIAETEKSWDIFVLTESFSNEYGYIIAKSPEEEKILKNAGFRILSNKVAIYKKALCYSLPLTTFEDITNTEIEQIVDRTMLRAIFGLYFDFKEEEFRTDLYERAIRLFDESSGGMIYEKGWHFLTQQLEKPMNCYITPKKKRK